MGPKGKLPVEPDAKDRVDSPARPAAARSAEGSAPKGPRSALSGLARAGGAGDEASGPRSIRGRARLASAALAADDATVPMEAGDFPAGLSMCVPALSPSDLAASPAPLVNSQDDTPLQVLRLPERTGAPGEPRAGTTEPPPPVPAGAPPPAQMAPPQTPAPRPVAPGLDSREDTPLQVLHLPERDDPPAENTPDAGAFDSRAATAARMAQPLAAGRRAEETVPEVRAPRVDDVPMPVPSALSAGVPTPSRPAPRSLLGRTLAGEFRILSLLGEGGFGAVFLADQLGAGGAPIRRVVVKTVRANVASSEEVLARFNQEARILAALSHPYIITLYRYGRLDDGQLFIAMEYGGDRDLAAELRAAGRMDAARALRIAEQVCDALHIAHRNGIIHRDLKPANILVTREDDGDRVKVVDLGIAKLVRELSADASAETVGTLTGANVFVGTAAYASPEQAEGGRIDERTDLYALGVVLYEMLVGRLPVRGDSVQALLLAHYGKPPIPPSEHGVTLAAPVLALLDKALAKKPDARFQSAREMREGLAAVRGTISDRLPSPVRHPGRMVAAVLLGVLGIAAAAGTGIWLARRGAPAPEGVPAPRIAAPAPAAEPPPLVAPVVAASAAPPSGASERLPAILLRPQEADVEVVSGGRRMRNPSSVPIAGESGDFQIVPAFAGFRISVGWRRDAGQVKLQVAAEPRAMIRQGAVRMGVQHELVLGTEPVLLGFKPMGEGAAGEFVVSLALDEGH